MNFAFVDCLKTLQFEDCVSVTTLFFDVANIFITQTVISSLLYKPYYRSFAIWLLFRNMQFGNTNRIFLEDQLSREPLILIKSSQNIQQSCVEARYLL